MKSFVAFLAIVGFIGIKGASIGETNEQHQQQQEDIAQIRSECLKTSAVNQDVLDKTKNGDFTDDEKLKSYLYCISKKTGFQNEQGELQKEEIIKTLIDTLKDKEAAEKLAEKCAVSKGTAEETAFYNYKCLYENTADHISLA